MLMKKGAAYARFSSDLQREESIEAQLKDIYEYAAKNNIIIVKEYCDEAITGKSDDRPAFQQMIADAKSRMFDVLLLHKIDRFARNKYDSAIYKHFLRKKCGIEIIYVKQILPDGPEGILMEGILESFAEYYSENLATEVMKGLKLNATKARFNGGYPPLGYDITEDKTYVINEKEARIVKEIFELYLKGYGYERIANILNSKGYRNKKGQPFVFNSIPNILSNEKYAGIYTYNKTSRSYTTEGRRNLKKYNSQEDIIKIEGGVPAIITKEMFIMVQEEMKKRAKTRGKSRAVREYILSGLIVCECGRHMVGYSQKRSKEGKRYFYYRCTGCNNSIKAEEIEANILEMLDKQIFSNIDGLMNKIRKYLSEQEKTRPDELRYLNAELKKTNEQINNIINMIMQGISSIKLGHKLEELETYKESIEDRIKEVNKISTIPEEDIKSWLLDIKRSFDAGENMKQIVSRFIKEIRVGKENYEVDFFVKAPYKGASSLSAAPSAPELFAQTYNFHKNKNQ